MCVVPSTLAEYSNPFDPQGPLFYEPPLGVSLRERVPEVWDRDPADPPRQGWGYVVQGVHVTGTTTFMCSGSGGWPPLHLSPHALALIPLPAVDDFACTKDAAQLWLAPSVPHVGVGEALHPHEVDPGGGGSAETVSGVQRQFARSSSDWLFLDTSLFRCAQPRRSSLQAPPPICKCADQSVACLRTKLDVSA